MPYKWSNLVEFYQVEAEFGQIWPKRSNSTKFDIRIWHLKFEISKFGWISNKFVRAYLKRTNLQTKRAINGIDKLGVIIHHFEIAPFINYKQKFVIKDSVNLHKMIFFKDNFISHLQPCSDGNQLGLNGHCYKISSFINSDNSLR